MWSAFRIGGSAAFKGLKYVYACWTKSQHEFQAANIARWEVKNVFMRERAADKVTWHCVLTEVVLYALTADKRLSDVAQREFKHTRVGKWETDS